MDERIDFPSQVSHCVPYLVIGTVVLHNVVGMDGHRANLGTKIGLDMFAFEPSRFLIALFQLEFIKACFEQLQRNFAVLDL